MIPIIREDEENVETPNQEREDLLPGENLDDQQVGESEKEPEQEPASEHVDEHASTHHDVEDHDCIFRFLLSEDTLDDFR